MGGVRNKSVDHDVVNKRITGLAEKFSMKGQDAKAEALQDYLKRLRGLARSLGGGDNARTIAASSEMDREEAAQNMVSSMLLMLLELSETPTMLRRGDHGYTIPDSLRMSSQKSKSQSQINKEQWEAILKEDPLEGEHWLHLETGDEDKESDGSDYEDMNVNPRAVPVSTRISPKPASDKRHIDESQTETGIFGLWAQSTREPRMHSQLKLLEQQQYWRDDVTAVRQHRADPQAVGEIDIQRALELNTRLRETKEYSLVQGAPIMDEADVIQEVFLLLQGLPTAIFTVQDGSLMNVRMTILIMK